MKSACAVCALTLFTLSGLAAGQSASSTYYPQCWFWQLPTNT